MRGIRRRTGAVAVAIATALAAVGCAGQQTQTTEDGLGDAPIKLGFMWEIKGESAYAIDDYDRGAAIAVEEINRAGDITVETVRLPASPVDPQALNTNFLKMTEEKPTVIVGIPGTNIESLTRAIDNARIPVIGIVQNSNINFGAPNGSEWLFQAYTSQYNYASSAARYLIEELKVKSVGIMHTDEALGTSGAAVFAEVFADAGVPIIATRSYATSATDLTEQVLAMRDADAVINWGYPNPMAVQLKQFVQNGITIPTMQTQSAALNVANGVVEGEAIANLYSAQFCNATDPGTEAGRRFIAAYQEKFGSPPTANAMITYDAVRFAAAAIRAANSTDPVKVRDAIRTIKFTDGACTDDYHADGAHVLMHQILIIDFPEGKGRTLKKYTFPDDLKVTS